MNVNLRQQIINYLWDLVNNIETHSDIDKAEKAIKSHEWLSIDEFDELMSTAAYRSRELYREERK